MINQLSYLAVAQFKESGLAFSVSGQDLAAEDLGAEDGLLGLFLYQASEIHEKMFQTRLPLAYEQNKEALLDYIPVIESEGFAVWAHVLHYGIEEEIRRVKRNRQLNNGVFYLDDLYKEWFNGIQQKKYPLLKPKSNTQSK